MRRRLITLATLAMALLPLNAQAQTSGVQVVGGNGLNAFGGVFTIAPNAALEMEGPGRDVGRDIAAYWVTYRWKKPARSSASCEVNLTRFDFLGFNGTMPEEATEVEKEAARLKRLAEAPAQPWTRITMTRRRQGRLSLLELVSVRNDGQEFLSQSLLFVEGRHTYEFESLCTGAALAELRDLSDMIIVRNITQP